VTVNFGAQLSAVVRSAMATPKPPRKKRALLHCIYCGLVVGEAIQFDDGLEYERYINTDKGPVCEECFADPLAEERAEQNDAQFERGVILRAQVKLAITNTERDERDAEIVRLHDAGATYAEIAPPMGLSKSGAATAARRARERAAASA